MAMSPTIQVLQDAPTTGRVMRRPQHSFTLRHRPWQIQPMLIAPVLPGETMKNLLLQSRVVSNPLKSELVGWWVEYYFFYVKQRDLPDLASNAFQQMHLANAATTFLQRGAYSAPLMTTADGLNVVSLCLQRVVEEYFRDEEDGAWNAKAIGGVVSAQVSKLTGIESLRDNAAIAAAQDHEMPGEVDPLPYGVNPAWQTYYDQWENMRALNLTAVSFEDYLKQFGVKTPEVQEKENRPELLRYIRQWTYPTNTINPSDGAPSTALSASISERADKDRAFNEPGYIFGVTVCRPKVYLGKQLGNLSSFLNDAFSWLPPTLAHQAYTSLKKFAHNAGPLSGSFAAGKEYWIDMRDLFVYGDQFYNYDVLADTTSGAVALPTSTFDGRYANDAMADALFKNAAANQIKQDGNVGLSILGKIVNET